MVHPLCVLILIRLLSTAIANFNPCHEYKHVSAKACDRVSVPNGLCLACENDADLFHPSGDYKDCTQSMDLTSNPQCLDKLQEYVEDNPCDDARADALDSFREKGDDKSRQILDYFIYSLCENICDCIPKIGASPDVPEISLERANCQSHVYWDVCSVLPNIRAVTASRPFPEGSEEWPKVCQLITDWINSPEGHNWPVKATTYVHPDVRRFLTELVHAGQILDPLIYHRCLVLETSQRQISVDGTIPETVLVESMPTPTQLPTVSSAPSTAAPSPLPTKSSAPTESSSPSSNLLPGTILEFFIVDANSNLKLNTAKDCSKCIDPSLFVNIIAEPYYGDGFVVEKVELALIRADTGQQIANRTESLKPYAVFGDYQGDYNGMYLSSGEYMILAQAFVNGEGGPVKKETFSVE